jgi:integrase
MKPNQYLLCRGNIYYLNLRLSEPLIKKHGDVIRISLKTDSVKQARIERDKIIGRLRVEADELSTKGSNLRYQEILTNLRLDRDSAPECFNVLSPDSINKEDDKDYVNAYIVAENEHIGLPTSDLRVKRASEQYQINLKECHALYIADNRNMKDSAAKTYQQAIDFLPKDMPEKPIHHILRQELKDLVQSTKLAYNTVSGRMSRLNNMVKYAIYEGKYNSLNPFDNLNVKSLMENSETDSYQNLPPALHFNALKASEGLVNWEYLVHRLLPLTGMRIGELLNIKKSDIVDGCIYIREAKTVNSVRTIPLTALMTQLLEKCPSDTEHLFPTAMYGSATTKMTRNKTKWGWNARHYSAHSYRGMCATALQEIGCPESDVNLILGHKAQTLSFSLYSKNPEVADRLRSHLEKVIDAPVMSALKAKLIEELNSQNEAND